MARTASKLLIRSQGHETVKDLVKRKPPTNVVLAYWLPDF